MRPKIGSKAGRLDYLPLHMLAKTVVGKLF